MKLSRSPSKTACIAVISLAAAIAAWYWFETKSLSQKPVTTSTTDVAPLLPQAAKERPKNTAVKNATVPQEASSNSDVQELVQSHKDGTKVFKTKEGFATILPDGRVLTLPDEL